MYTIIIQFKDGRTETISELKAIHCHSNGAIDLIQYQNMTPFFPGIEETVHSIQVLIVRQNGK